MMSFPTTNWGTLAKATLNGGEVERAALGRFCERYWKPVAMVIRAKGAPAERVEDLTQDFFLKLMEGSFVRRAAEEHGKFRSFLLKALQNFLVDDVRKAMAVKRGGSMERVELKDDTASLQDDELKFDEAWAEAVFEAAVDATASEVRKKRGEEKWQALSYFLTGVGEVTSYEEVGGIFEISAASAKSEVSRVRAKFREHLRRQVALTVRAPHEIEEELAFLHEVMIRKSSQKDV